MRRILLLLSLAAIIAIALSFQVGRLILFGWATFCWRNLAQVTVSGVGLATGAVVIAVLLGTIHYLGCWWCRTAAGEPDAIRPRWRLRWSASIVLGVLLMFVAGFAAIGIARHLGWLLSPDEPWYGERLSRHFGDSKANLKMVGMAMSYYEQVYGRFPPGGTPAGHGWAVSLLPYLNYKEEGIDAKLPWNDPKNAAFFRKLVPEYLNPELSPLELFDADGFGLNHYAGNSRVLLPNQSLTSAEVTDGLANTILIGEVNCGFKAWGRPANCRDPAAGLGRAPETFGGGDPSGGANFLFMDGSVRFLSNQTDPTVLRALSTPAGGEKVPEGGW